MLLIYTVKTGKRIGSDK